MHRIQNLFQDFAPVEANASYPILEGASISCNLYYKSNCDCYICYMYSLLHCNTCIRANQISREGGGGTKDPPPPKINPGITICHYSVELGHDCLTAVFWTQLLFPGVPL